MISCRGKVLKFYHHKECDMINDDYIMQKEWEGTGGHPDHKSAYVKVQLIFVLKGRFS